MPSPGPTPFKIVATKAASQHTESMRKALLIILFAGGITAILIALLHIVLGPSAIPGSVPVNATMDSEDRFYATLFLGYGLALIWCARAPEARAGTIRSLILLFFAGGVARVVSIKFAGPPNLFFEAMTALELLLPPAILFLLYRLEHRRST
jgi:hypothetical protein